jgi:uncharacterized integral membrane protein
MQIPGRFLSQFKTVCAVEEGDDNVGEEETLIVLMMVVELLLLLMMMVMIQENTRIQEYKFYSAK